MPDQLELLPDTTEQALNPSQPSVQPEILEGTLEESYQDISIDMEPLNRIAAGKSVRIPKNPHFTRKDVVNAFQQSFELMGGVPRLAVWGHQNETDFFKLYARLLPSQASSALGESNVMRIEMAISPGPLDE